MAREMRRQFGSILSLLIFRTATLALIESSSHLKNGLLRRSIKSK